MKIPNRRDFLVRSGMALGLTPDSKMRESVWRLLTQTRFPGLHILDAVTRKPKAAPQVSAAKDTSPEGRLPLYNVDFRSAIGLGDEPPGIVDRFGQLLRSRNAMMRVALGSPLQPAEHVSSSQSLRNGYLPIVDTELTVAGTTLHLSAFSSDDGGLKADYVEIRDGKNPYQIQLFFPYTTAIHVEGGKIISQDRVLAQFPQPAKATVSRAKYNSLTPETWPATDSPWGKIEPLKLDPGVDSAFANSRNTFLNRWIEYRFPVKAGTAYHVFLGILPDKCEPGEYIFRLSVNQQTQRLDCGLLPPGKPVTREFTVTPAENYMHVKCATDPSATHPFRDCHLNGIWIFDRPADARQVEAGRLNDQSIFYVQCGREPIQDIASSVVLDYDPASSAQSRWICLPYDLAANDITRAAGLSADSARTAVKGCWDSLLRRGSEFTTGIPHLDQLYKASLINLFLLRSRYPRAGSNGQDIYVAKPGPDTYDNFWTRDGSYIVLALEAAGLPDEAEQSLRLFWQSDLTGTLASWGQQANGSWAAPVREWDAQGQAISALVSHYEFTRDLAWLRSAYESIRRGALWIKNAAEQTQFVNENGKKPLHYGLLPEGEGEAIGYGYIYYHCFWSVLGIRQAVRAAEALGHPDDVRWMKRVAEEFCANLLASVKQAYESTAGGKFIPATPYDPHASAWGSIAALYPCHFLAPHDPMITGTLKSLEDQMVEDMWPFAPGNLWTYFNPSLAMCHLLRGELPNFYTLFNSYVRHASPTNAWTEGILLNGRIGTGDMPHGWAAAAYVQILRDCFVFENDRSLELGWGVQPEWLPDGAKLSAKRAASRFGTVDFELHRSGTLLSVDYHLTHTSLYPSPEEVRFHIPKLAEKLTLIRANGKQRPLAPGEETVKLE
jgi:hypothetical protein